MSAARWIAVVAVAALTGCQAGGTEGPEEQATATVESFLEDCARGEIVGAMDILTEPVKARFVALGSGLEACLRTAGLAAQPADLPPEEMKRILSEARVVSVGEIFGEQYATATIEGPDGTRSELDLDQRAVHWRIATPPR